LSSNSIAVRYNSDITNLPMSRTKKTETFIHNLIWFEIPVDKPDRAQKFYKGLFGWKINAMPDMKDYWHIDTAGPDATPDGGMMPRMYPGQPITSYVHVASVAKAVTKVEKLGGKICKPKTAVPGMGYLAICEDTEGNTFALWEVNPKAK
jgi:predicted enzyme related to lactoylglutathione lyase